MKNARVDNQESIEDRRTENSPEDYNECCRIREMIDELTQDRKKISEKKEFKKFQSKAKDIEDAINKQMKKLIEKLNCANALFRNISSVRDEIRKIVESSEKRAVNTILKKLQPTKGHGIRSKKYKNHPS